MFVAGQTSSADFPANPNPIQALPGGGVEDAFVTELNPSLSKRIYSTYLGGSGDDSAYGIAVDADGAAYVVGKTNSNNFLPSSQPLPPFQSSPKGAFNAFVTKISGTGLTVSALPIAVSKNLSISAPVALFYSQDTSLQASDFQETVDWGDGTLPSLGSITLAVKGSAPEFVVSASHTYAKPGAYPVVVTVTSLASGTVASTAENLTRSNGNEDDETIAADPNNPLLVFSAANVDSGGALAASYSQDGGQTWFYVNAQTGTIAAGGSDGLPKSYGFPQAAFDQFHNLFLTYIAADKKSVVVALSKDGGRSFTTIGIAPVAGVDPDTSQLYLPTLVTGPGVLPGTGSVWVGGTDVTTHTFVTFEATVSAQGIVGNLTSDDPRSQVVDAVAQTHVSLAVGPAGQVLAAFLAPSTTAGQAVVATSIDLNAAGFSPAQPGATTSVVGNPVYSIPAQSVHGIAANPILAWDDSPGLYHGRVYLIYLDADPATPADTSVIERSSDDGGRTWSQPVVVNSDVTGAGRFLPNAVVDQSTGVLAVGWYDTRDDPTNEIKTRYYIATSSDGGATFSTNSAVSPAASDATDSHLDPFGHTFQYGDYTGLAFAGGVLYSSWADDSGRPRGNPAVEFDGVAAAVSVATVIIPKPVVTALPLSAVTTGALLYQQVATFTDANASLTTSDFQVTIQWGDGGQSPADAVSQTGGTGTPFQIFGSHTYATFGVYPVVVTVVDTKNKVTATTVTNLTHSSDNDSRPSIIVDPTNPLSVFEVSYEPTEYGIQTSQSNDGGVTWSPILTIAAGGSDMLPRSSQVFDGLYDAYGNLYLAYRTEDSNTFEIIARNAGDSSFRPVGFETVDGAAGTVNLQSVQIATGPGPEPGIASVWFLFGDKTANSLYATHIYVDNKATGDDLSQIYRVSGDPVPVPGSSGVNYYSIAVGPAGQAIVVYQKPSTSPGIDDIYESVNPDDIDEAEFGLPKKFATTRVVGVSTYKIPAMGTAGISSSLQVVWDDYSPAHTDRIFLVYSDAPTIGNTSTTIEEMYSDNEGKNWTDPSAVSTPIGAESQFLPSLSLQLGTGDLAVGWYDTRDDPTKQYQGAILRGDQRRRRRIILQKPRAWPRRLKRRGSALGRCRRRSRVRPWR